MYTDHSPLQAMFTAKHSPAGRWVKWVGIVDVDIQYRSGQVNSNADAPSKEQFEQVFCGSGRTRRSGAGVDSSKIQVAEMIRL